MRALRLSIAFIAGMWLYYIAVVFFGGVLAAIAIPRGYFAYFGREHLKMALALLSLFEWAIPVAIMVAGGFLALHRLLSAPAQSVWIPALAGMVVSYLYWALVSIGYFSSNLAPLDAVLQLLHYSFAPPWFGAPNTISPWLGTTLAIWLIIRAQRPRSPSEA